MVARDAPLSVGYDSNEIRYIYSLQLLPQNFSIWKPITECVKLAYNITYQINPLYLLFITTDTGRLVSFPKYEGSNLERYQ